MPAPGSRGCFGMLDEMTGYRVLLLVVDDTEVAIEMMIALEDAGHSVEHVFHVDEAMLRVRTVKPDAFVVAAPPCDESLARGWSLRHPDVAMVLVAPSPGARIAAQKSGVPCLERPINPDRLIRVIERRVERGRGGDGRPGLRRARLPEPPSGGPPSGMRIRARHLLVVAPRHIARRLDADLLRRHLEAECSVACDTRAAMQMLDAPLDGVLMDSALMVDPAAGVLLRQRIHAKGVPISQVRFDPHGDFISAISAIRDAADVLHGQGPARQVGTA